LRNKPPYTLQPRAISSVDKSEQFSPAGLLWQNWAKEGASVMGTKTLLIASAATLTSLAALTLAKRYQQWKRREAARVKAGAQVVTTARGPIEYCKDGEGPALLVIHGSPGGYDHGMGLAQFIDANGFTILAPSRPGYLHTPLSSGTSPEAQADLYAALLDTLNIEQATVVGASGGGPSALQFALRHPDRCRGLVLLCAVSQRYVEAEVYQKLSPGSRLGKQLINNLVLFEPFIYVLQALTGLQKRSAFADVLSSLSLASLRKEGYRNDMQQFAEMSPYPLENINVPTFIAHGTADTELPFAHAQLLANSIPGAHFVPVPDGDHLFFITHQQMVMPALRNFLFTL
jgi:pimeloyl-ACP methyl ester carboxylesterase